MAIPISISNTYLQEVLNNQAALRLLDLFHVGIVLISTDGIIRYVNKAYVEMHGLKNVKCIGERVKDVFDTADEGCLKVLRTQKRSMGESHSCKGVRGINFRYPVYDSNNLVGCLVETIFTDIDKDQMIDLINSFSELQKKAYNYEKVIQNISDRLYTFDSLVGESIAFREMIDIGKRFAQSSQPILVYGESGTGKELVAQALHTDSPRNGKPFITVNCAALPQELVESELFGYSEGAFTGSKKGGMKGKFELADTGTIFLDEIGEMPFSLQAKLLRVLETHEIQKIGHHRSVYTDFRLIVATNKNLINMVDGGTFREDLYHRLSILELNIPPLRRRKEDIPGLTSYLIEQELGFERGSQIRLSSEVLRLFREYSWKGNVRELKNVLIYAICCLEEQENMISLAHVPDRIKTAHSSLKKAVIPSKNNDTLADASAAAEREVIIAALEKCGQNKSRAARELGIARSNLYTKMRVFGLQ
ncbi:sigma 54-interacting transcriptional regulator [bacterium]|nr:sigma 54-interacting transcriptional regulator [bacterium]